MQPLHRCNICREVFLEPETDLWDNNPYCPGCGVPWKCIRTLSLRGETQLFYQLIDRNFSRSQRKLLLGQFDSPEE